MASFRTRNWIIGILAAAWVASFAVGFLHGAKVLPEPDNPVLHTFQDWILVVIPLLPISYAVARLLPQK